MIKLEMVTNAGPWRKGQTVTVPEEDHWLVTSGYARVVERVEDLPSAGVGGDRTPASGSRVARRSAKKVTGGSDRTEFGSGSSVRTGSGSASGVDSGEPVVSADASNGTPESGSPSRVG